MKYILHICWGTGTNNGAANIARLIMGEQRSAGDEPVLVSRPSWAQLRLADQVWCHCGWYWVIWLVAAYKRFFRRSSSSSSTYTYLHWVPECCYDPIRLRYHGWKKALVGLIERWALRQADILVATCEAEEKWIREYLRYNHGEQIEHGEGPRIVVSDIKRFFRFSNGDNKNRCQPQPSASTLKILYLGRPHPLKGVKYLERAVEELNGHSSTSALAVSLRIVSDHVGKELERDWDWCDVLCLPTLSDNFGLVIAEAIERGKRVLTTDGAPAWEPEQASSACVESETNHSAILHSTLYDLTYLRGYRDGNDETRVKLLTEAIGRMAHLQCTSRELRHPDQVRRREYDVARGLAVIFMIAVHVLHMAYNGGSTVVCRLVDFFGSAPAAPVFMFLLGCNVPMSRHNEPRALFMRGLKLFLASYLFNAVCHALPAYIAGLTHPTHGWQCAVIGWLFAVDILTFAGLAFMALGVVRKLKLTPAAYFGIAVALHAAGTFLNAACQIPFETNMIGAGLLSILYNASTPGYFSFLTWIVYPAAGMFFADFFRRATDEECVWWQVGSIAGILFAAMLACFCAISSVHDSYYADEYVYYRNGYFLLVHNLAFVVAWLALWHFLCCRFARLGTGLLLLLSRNLTKIYVMQWFFIGAFFIAPFGETIKFGTGAFLAAVVGILCLCILIVRLLGKEFIGGEQKRG